MQKSQNPSLDYVYNIKEQLLHHLELIKLLRVNYLANEPQIFYLYQQIKNIKSSLSGAFHTAGNNSSLKQLKLLKSLKDQIYDILNQAKISMLEGYSLDKISPQQLNALNAISFDNLFTINEMRKELDIDLRTNTDFLSIENLNHLLTICQHFESNAISQKEHASSKYHSDSSKLTNLESIIFIANSSVTLLENFIQNVLNYQNSWRRLSAQCSRNYETILVQLELKDGTQSSYAAKIDESQNLFFEPISTPSHTSKQPLHFLDSLQKQLDESKEDLNESFLILEKANAILQKATHFKECLRQAISAVTEHIQSTN